MLRADLVCAVAAMEESSPARSLDPAVLAALDAGSPNQLLAAIGCGPSDIADSSRRRERARIAEGDADIPPPAGLLADSTGLLHEHLARGPEGRVALSDSEASSDSELEPHEPTSLPVEKGEGAQTQGPRRKRRRAIHHRRRKRTAGLLADARYSPPPYGELEHAAASPDARRSPPAAHPARQRGAQDAEGFFQVQSRRFGRMRSPRRRSPPRRSPPRSPSFLPPELEGACYRCLRFGHVRVRCFYPARCYRCWAEGHHAAECPDRRRDFRKRGRSPLSEGERRAAARHRFRPRHSPRRLGPRRPSLAATFPPATAPSTCPISAAALLRLNTLRPAGVVRAGTPPWSRCPLLFSAMMPPGSSAPLAGRLAPPLTPLSVRGALKRKWVPPTRRLVKLRVVPPARLSAPTLRHEASGRARGAPAPLPLLA